MKEEENERLRTQIVALRTKCGKLEAQNILVSVQQLDLLTRFMAMLSSFMCLYAYWKALDWIMSSSSLCDWSAWRPMTLPGAVPRIVMEWLGKSLLYTLPYLHHRCTHGLMYRRFEVFAVFTIVLLRMKMCRWRERMFAAGDKEDRTDATIDGDSKIPAYGTNLTEDDIWDANYEISARFLYVSILRLQGLWTKSAQYLSSRADFMPASYVRELQKLQDSCPQTEWTRVLNIIPKHVMAALTDINPTALASASIGQVHTARLRSSGQKVVVKVQHPRARTLLLDDFWSLHVFCRIVRYLEPEYGFIEILMREWASEARKELDFLQEKQNLLDAASSIEQMSDNLQTMATPSITSVPFEVEIPTPFEELCTRDVLVMTFSEGFRIDNVDQIKASKLSPEAVMDSVAQTFSHMMYICGPFNGDPHAGNLLVRPGTTKSPSEGFTIVLLDWGLAKRLPEDKRFAFCQMAYAAATCDFGLLLDSFDTIGLRMKRENTAEDMVGILFLLREVVPPELSRKRIKAKIKIDKKRRAALEKGKKVPMESKAYPGEFFFYVRVNELLHGLGSKYRIQFSYIDAIKPYARRGLSQFLCQAHPKLTKSPVPARQNQEPNPLTKRIAEILASLKRQGSIAGSQVCVLDRGGQTLAQVVDGHMGGLFSHVPMQSDALILGYSCTKAVAATLAHTLVSEGYLGYDEPICERVWPAFAPFDTAPVDLEQSLNISRLQVEERWAWKRNITLRHILTHSAGLWSALPSTLTIKKLASCEDCVGAFEYDPNTPEEFILPTSCPGTTTLYHFLSFGWLVAGPLIGAYALKHGLDRKSVTFEEVYEAKLVPLLSKETVENGFRPCGGTGDFPIALTETKDIALSQLLQSRIKAKSQGEDASDMSRMLDSIGDAKGEMKRMLDLARGKEFLLDQRIWNSKSCLNANCPAAGGRFSANGLAKFYHDLGTGRILDEDAVVKASTTILKMEASNLQGQTNMRKDNDEEGLSLGLGYQLITFPNDSSEQPGAFGHAGVGGSIGFHHRDSGISVAVMLNKADSDKNAAKSIVQAIAKHFGW